MAQRTSAALRQSSSKIIQRRSMPPLGDQLGNSTWHVLTALAMQPNHIMKGTEATRAKAAHMSLRTFQRAVSEARKWGLISVDVDYRDGEHGEPRRTANTKMTLLPKGAELLGLKRQTQGKGLNRHSGGNIYTHDSEKESLNHESPPLPSVVALSPSRSGDANHHRRSPASGPAGVTRTARTDAPSVLEQDVSVLDFMHRAGSPEAQAIQARERARHRQAAKARWDAAAPDWSGKERGIFTRTFKGSVGDVVAFAGWLHDHWQDVATAAFPWMTMNPPPERPTVRFVTWDAARDVLVRLFHDRENLDHHVDRAAKPRARAEARADYVTEQRRAEAEIRAREHSAEDAQRRFDESRPLWENHPLANKIWGYFDAGYEEDALAMIDDIIAGRV